MIKLLIHSTKQGEMWTQMNTLEEAQAFIDDAKLTLHYGDETECQFEIVDITEELAQEQAMIEAIKQAQLQAGLRLQQFPEQIDACQDLESLKVTIKILLQDIAILLK
jgi:hypothetical protein